ncbi:carboxypeptidase-like regulatory domain-containing protein [Bacteroides sp.]|uniref:carboxypeptidase-like regulatory domain-containing protein n=1 Tax=Bacteroides sp. TaxID=29523 RepID=UPI00263013D7|nr:carboxypeptidase-like regulatory domain-containing protein [Bacteroides sp.]MDD3037620.1 carboxypeptidase-like regulatory domain-containing protein [Bacteroides sp.]
MNSKFFGLGAKLALCFVAVLGTLTSCYEKEDIKTVIDTTPKTVTYTISGSVYNYASLAGINGASVVLTKAGAETEKAKTVTKDGGQFAITLSGLTDADRGDYTLTVKAEGYKDRKTNVTIFFEKADNQTIVTHMDFALKSNEIQGEKVEIVAGKEEQTEIFQGVDSEGKPSQDIVVVPADLFPDGEAKTITLIREGQKEEIANDAVRVWEGKPDGTKFDKSLVFTFTDKPNQVLKVYYEVNGIWTLAEKDAEIVEVNGVYTAKVNHFSRFKFSATAYDSYSITDGEAVMTTGLTKDISLAYHNSLNAPKAFPFEVKGFAGGAKFEKPLDEVFANCPIKDEAINYMKNYLNEIYSELPGSEYKVVDFNTEISIPAHSDLSGVGVTQTLKSISYTMTVAGANYVVTVVAVEKYTFSTVGFVSDYTHGQGIGHGHGHGDDLNAGGGIINFE